MKSQHSFEEDPPMKQKLLSVLSALLSLCLMLFCPESLAENREVYASQGGAAFFRESGKIGLQAEDGTVLHPAEFDGAAYFDETQQASIYTEEGIGRIDRTGKVVIAPFPCDSIRAIPTRSEKAGDPAYLLLVSWYTKDGQEMMRLMTVDGQWLGDVQFDLMMNDFTNGRMFIRLFDEYNQIDAQGNLTAEDWWLQLTVNSLTGACALESTGDYLYFDTQGYPWARESQTAEGETQTLLLRGEHAAWVPESWTSVEWIGDGYTAYREDDLWGVAGPDDKTVLKPQSGTAPWLINADEDIWAVTDAESGSWKWIHSDGTVVAEMNEGEDLRLFARTAYSPENRYIVSSETSPVTRILDSTGKTVAEIDSSCYLVEGEDPSLSLYCRLDGNNEGVWGFISRDGEILCEYPESLREYSTDDTEPVNGWFRVTDENSGKNGYVNTQGNKLLSDEWTEIRNFTGNGRARVKVGDFYGFIGTDGKYTTSPDWEYALDYFQADGRWIAPVFRTSGNGTITWQGFIDENNQLISEHYVTPVQSEYLMESAFDSTPDD